ncbi:MAG TPA: diguanylate cyclase [Acidimicrobiales bacterium]|nr:diguanylate cyclase [Acidimicrobiales bacterium]
MTYASTALSLDGLAAEIDLLEPDLPVAVAMIDLDKFEQLNDTHGEAAGDSVLGLLRYKDLQR